MEKKKILIAEILGFALVMIFIWLDEILDLPYVLFGAPQTPINFTESILESAIILILGFFTILISKKMLNKIEYLEQFLRICCVCKKIYDVKKDAWIPLEQYFDKYSRIEFSHGFCNECIKMYDKK